MSIGHLVALLVMIAALVLVLVGRMETLEGVMFAALALAIFLTAWPLRSVTVA